MSLPTKVNILIDGAGNARLADFGWCRSVDPSTCHSQVIVVHRRLRRALCNVDDGPEHSSSRRNLWGRYSERYWTETSSNIVDGILTIAINNHESQTGVAAGVSHFPPQTTLNLTNDRASGPQNTSFFARDQISKSNPVIFPELDYASSSLTEQGDSLIPLELLQELVNVTELGRRNVHDAHPPSTTPPSG